MLCALGRNMYIWLFVCAMLTLMMLVRLTDGYQLRALQYPHVRG